MLQSRYLASFRCDDAGRPENRETATLVLRCNVVLDRIVLYFRYSSRYRKLEHDPVDSDVVTLSRLCAML
jgi:hypothetical protein